MNIRDFILKLFKRKASSRNVFYVDHNKVDIRQDGNDVKLSISDTQNILLPNQTISSIKQLLLNNYRIVKEHYRSNAEKAISAEDLNDISLKIVVDRLYMYNMWRIWYKKQENRDLNFITEDFDHPDLQDTIMIYLRKKYPQDYHKKCEIIFSMTSAEFEAHEKNRDNYFNK